MPYRALTHLIDSHFEVLSPELQRAARWVREHPAELGLQSLRASARAAGVAPATLSRLSHALGLDDFEAMRRPVVEALARGAGGGLVAANESDEPVRPLTQAQLRNVASTASRNTVDVVNAAADVLLAARQLCFLGLRASFGIAHHLRYACDWLRPDTLLAGDASGALVDQIAQLTPADALVVVSQAPYTRQTVECAQLAFEAGVPLIALTDSPLSPLARLARHALLFDAASPSFFHSMAGAQALAETLVAAVAARGGEPVVRRLAEVQARQHAHKAYWEKRPLKANFS
ncbi:MAG: MurR/RpiR family transcriptional regulator [Hydrogenophaga sp.]|nr:MurR/RpiR family transcriptional regulator [Hydrogenophaga sp.]